MKILAVKHVNTKDGNPRILITTAQADIWCSVGQWKSAGAGNTLANFVGGEVEPVYFAKGELLFDGVTECTQDNTILRQVFLTENPVVLANSLAIENSAKMNAVSDMSALFARKRAEEKAKQAAQPKAKALAEE